MYLVGLTGGIASGKTLVSDTFASLGAMVIDADILARVAVEPESEGLNGLRDLFGSGIITKDAELDRSALRNIIFSNQEHRQSVDKLLHPIIRQLSDNQIADATEQGYPYVVYAVPLLFETTQQDRFNRIAVVDVPVEIQIERLMSRDGGTRDKAQAIIDAQATREERLGIADDVIDNTGTPEEVQAQVAKLHTRYLKLASAN